VHDLGEIVSHGIPGANPGNRGGSQAEKYQGQRESVCFTGVHFSVSFSASGLGVDALDDEPEDAIDGRDLQLSLAE
jgi:hypothetical protein